MDALQLFTVDLQKQLGQKESKKGDFNEVVATKWAELSYDEKRGYYDRATAAAAASPIEGASAKPKKTTNIPLPALKRFAATIASGLKEKQPHLAELQHVRIVSCSNFWYVEHLDLFLTKFIAAWAAEQDNFEALDGFAWGWEGEVPRGGQLQANHTHGQPEGVAKERKSLP